MSRFSHGSRNILNDYLFYQISVKIAKKGEGLFFGWYEEESYWEAWYVRLPGV